MVKESWCLTKELQGVMINSVLSGPKTPARAIMGTGTATFLRPFSQVLGATLSGDRATQSSFFSFYELYDSNDSRSMDII